MIKIEVSRAMQNKIRKGWPWVFDYQIVQQSGRGVAGDLGVVYDSQNKFLAIGLYDPDSPLRLSILQSRKPTSIDAAFFRRQLQTARERRLPLLEQETNGCRWIHGEGDGFPGLVLDGYADTGVLKIYSAAWFPHMETLRSLIEEIFKFKRCVLRLSRNLQDRESLSKYDFIEGQMLFGPAVQGAVLFKENGLVFECDPVRGQKTGFFLDQRDNRARVKQLAKGKSVLNVFSYSGAFSVYAFSGDCRSVLEIDLNRFALDASRRNCLHNFDESILKAKGLEQMEGDAYEALSELQAQKRTFDLVILDPPAFARSKSQAPKALAAYSRLSQLGCAVTAPGGVLIAASCSKPVGGDEFFQAVLNGAEGRVTAELERTGHALDHPAPFAECEYLKAIYLKLS
ncbi:MAG: class I SAM-dependent rRNA methyltransferase [Candidatus Nitrohelix vancouverensis]|uniref:Class I SAM-dependent rRNA methyltransferase n=1 Tax=Candidatus Nitrohelix vancouverensis TaxID=2705534 RepID=A0A7T0G2V4_9BACT|nr:MAG: class I SAM-dependent rRNA methyltransferase [Candidatus Nitrohelix vancouverensis]